MDTQKYCFFIMPFSAEYSFLYYYLKEHIKLRFSIESKRADSSVATRMIPDKIKTLIKNAEVIIADCSDDKPNVLYELGFAHAIDKDVIMIRKNHDNLPLDIQSYDIISYLSLTDFIKKLNDTLSTILNKYDLIHKRALTVFNEFKQQYSLNIEKHSKKIFIEKIKDAEKTKKLPSIDDKNNISIFVLPIIVKNSEDPDIMSRINDYLLQL